MKTGDTATPAERATLSRETIVLAAIALADRQGAGSVTIRGVATALGVTPMALYWHFRKKDDLIAGMVDWVFEQMDLAPDEGEGWESRLRALLEAELAILRAHPALASLMLAHDAMSPHLLRIMERALSVLRAAGFGPAAAVQIVQHAQQTVVNLVLRQPGRGPGTEAREAAESERQTLANIQALPPDEYPHIIEAAVPLSRCDDPEEYYRFGIDLLFAGIRAVAEREGIRA
jgi:TetR/AcrR family transcriptional regulator, tetracycline repressor protein